MPRTLPWLSKAAANNDTKSWSSSPAPKRRKRESSPGDLVDAHLNNVATPPPRPRQKQRAERDPSTSPAGPAAPAPHVEHMRPGANADDVWLMVEDEFVSTANIYSRHLHDAEYARLKKLSKSRGERTLSALDHGTDGRTEKSRAQQQREEKEENERKTQEALDMDEDDAGGDAYLQDPQLASLMTTDKDRRAGRALAGIVKAKSNTRAAAGFLESPHTAKRHRDALNDDDGGAGKRAKASSSRAPKVVEAVAEDDEDDLDVKPAMSSHKPELKQNTRVHGDDQSRRRDVNEASSDNMFKRFAEPSKDRSSGLSGTPKKSSSTQSRIEDADDSYNAPRPKPSRPTYKKAQNRQASQTPSTQDASRTIRAPMRPTASESGLFKRSSISSSTANGSSYGDAEPVLSTSPDEKTSSSSATLDSRDSSGRNGVKAAAAGYLANRAADRARREKEQQGRGKRVDEIPTFLF